MIKLLHTERKEGNDMVSFITMFVICVLVFIIGIILGFKVYQRKERNKKIIHINHYQRKKENRLMLMSVIALTFSSVTMMYTLLNSVPPPTIYPLNNEARIYGETAEVYIDSYPFFTTYYSLDGSDPKDGYIYEDSFTVTETTTVVAKNRFLYFFWSEPYKNTYRFESGENITVNNVDNNIDNHIEDLFAYLITFLLLGSIFIPIIRDK